ncbi:murein hydrolase activator EnvC family protein [Cnuibacter sp. UC19_7]|uniref:murein hydrolase activator EnvC family protein n=1 Tax=Cnuibacter sp. UC19_7 TaxID=3350166 RepID=UPI00366E1213
MLRVLLALVSSVLVLLGPPSAGARHPRWAWPVEGAPVVARGYEAPATRYGAGHRGLDLAVGVGGVVLAPADGTVAFAGQVAGRPVLALEHGGGYRSSLEPVSSTLAVGDTVTRGQPVGAVAEGGHCTGCVHFGVRLRGEYLDPRALIVGIPRAVLLPAVAVAPVAPAWVVAARLSPPRRVLGADPRRGQRVVASSPRRFITEYATPPPYSVGHARIR